MTGAGRGGGSDVMGSKVLVTEERKGSKMIIVMIRDVVTMAPHTKGTRPGGSDQHCAQPLLARQDL